MANRHRGAVAVKLDGKTLQLRYSLNALAEIEDRLKLNSIAEILETLKTLSMRSLRTLLWAGLIHANADLTEQDVGEMDFDFASTLAKVSEAIGDVFKSPEAEASTDATDVTEGNARRPSRGAGTAR